MAIEKPPSVAADAIASEMWDELVAGRDISPARAPELELLCAWHAVSVRARDELAGFGGQTAYTTETGELRAFPQISTLRQASAEIRALAKSLGLEDAPRAARKETPLNVIQFSRAKKARAAGA